MKVLNILTKIIISSFIMALLISTIVFAKDNKTKIEVEDVSASGGEIVEVPINISDNVGICGATLSIAYDNKLKLNSIVAGDAWTSLTMTKPGDLTANPINILWDGVESDSTNGLLLTLTFEVPNNIGEYSVNISYDTGDIMNGNLEPVEVEICNGKITVENTESIYDCLDQGHKGGIATCTSLAQCEVCKTFYGEYDLNNHTGTIVTRNRKVATCMEDGYTGDKYCDACNNVVEAGKKEDKLEHVFINYSSDENATIEKDGTKTAECEYGCGTTDTITDVGSRLLSKCELEGHKGGVATCMKKAICEVCHEEYGELDVDNHVGDTEVKNASKPTCLEEGYEGDLYCCDCGNMISEGKAIPAIGHFIH